MYEDILIPTDGSAQATNAVKTGLALAGELGATAHAVYVVEEFEGRVESITSEQAELSEQYHEHGEEIVGEVASAAESMGVECVTAVDEGVVYNELENYVESNDIDVIVMGSRGLTNVEKAILGSTSDKIIRTLDIPTTVVHKPPQSFPDIDREIHLDGW
ncbi:MAG: universal stress protein [Haloferacaceae archaeon]